MRTERIVIFLFILFICSCQGAIRGKKYKPGDEIPLFINTIGPLSNPSVTFEYYSLPFCRPEQLEKKQTMGMAIDGDRLYNSLYTHKFAGFFIIHFLQDYFKKIKLQKIISTKSTNIKSRNMYKKFNTKRNWIICQFNKKIVYFSNVVRRTPSLWIYWICSF